MDPYYRFLKEKAKHCLAVIVNGVNVRIMESMITREDWQGCRKTSGSLPAVEVPSTPTTILCKNPECNEQSFLDGYCSKYSDAVQRSVDKMAQTSRDRRQGRSQSQEGGQGGSGSSVEPQQA